MEIITKIDEYGKPAWIGLLVLSFIIFWPIGLALLAYLIWSGRMGCWKHAGSGWHDRMHECRARRHGHWHHHHHHQSSGNAAFDEYREQTLKRLEEEQQEFKTFLDRLRHAKDKAKFDEFMAERRRPRPSAEPDAGVEPQT